MACTAKLLSTISFTAVESLSAFLYSPSESAPGNRMLFGGTETAEEARQIAEYVLSLP